MDFDDFIYWAIAFVLTVQVVATMLRIGQPTEPISNRVAVIYLILNSAMLWGVWTLWQS